MKLKSKINLTIILFLILSIILILFLVSPFFQDVRETSRSLTSKKEEVAFLEQEIKNLEEFKQIYQEVKSSLEKIETLLARAEEPVEFIKFLEKASQDCQVSIEIFPFPAKKIEPDIWPSMFFQIVSVGPPSNTLKFVEKLESSPYLIEIQNLSVNRLTETDLKLKGFETFSLNDVKGEFMVKVFVK